MGRIAARMCVLCVPVLAGAASAEADVVPVEGPWHATTSAGLPVAFEVTGGEVVALLRRCRHCPHPEVRRPKVVVRRARLTDRNGHRVYERIRWFFRGPVPRGFARHGSWLLDSPNRRGWGRATTGT